VSLRPVPRPFALSLERMVVPNEDRITTAILKTLGQLQTPDSTVEEPR